MNRQTNGQTDGTSCII